MPLSLPIDDAISELLAALRANSCLVLRAPTGSGKTTRVPPALLDAGLAREGAILVLQPRRVAARATATRMAQERGGEVGGEIGFQTRFERRVSDNSRIVCITEGILLRRLLDDPFLEGVACVVFDEFHERNLASDLALGMIRQVQRSVRPELKIVVMSATLDPVPISSYLGDCPTLETQGRTYPVTIEYLRQLDRRPLPELAAWGVHELLPRTEGDLLVFLPGVGEIKATARKLAALTNQRIALHELYGDLPPSQQDAVLQPGSHRKVILATNVAETSLTIEGVTGVIDTGLARVASYEEQSGLDRLQLVPISQAAAEQRSGRAGRTAPGLCLRLWPEAAQRVRPERETPEIRRVDLAGAVLQLACSIEPNLQQFPWFEPPRATSLDQAVRLLTRLEAISPQGGITELGRAMAHLPLPPRLSRMLVEGTRLGYANAVALGAALLSERDPFLRSHNSRGRRQAAHTSSSDLLDRMAALEAYESRGTLESEPGTLQTGAAQNILRVRDQLLRATAKMKATSPVSNIHHEEAVLRAVLAGYPDRVAKRRELNSRRGVLVGGRGGRLDDTSAVDQAELFVCLHVEGSSGEALVRMASAVRRQWLPESLLVTRIEVFFEEARQQLAARRRVFWDDLLLEESPTALPRDETTTEALALAAREHWSAAFPSESENVMSFLHRVRFLGRAMPEVELPAFTEEDLQSLLPQLCQGRRSLEELRRAPWLDYLRGALSYAQLQTLDREAPEKISVPSGNRIALDYSGERPILAVRIQELFGLPQTPRVAAGRVPVLLHLLAPNMRPHQITDDLTSFWNNTYQQVRKDLRNRYPKHSWPEDPWNAPAESRPRRK